ncbi:MAG: glycoside hydrolase family protein [Clostridia bacterium]|nr:glycoside hydrolase family protein [Clostridia bacterium]
MEKVFEFYPAVKGSGFQMEGYHIWCGSVLKEGDTYYLFAARWKKEKSFPLGYLTDSEIVLAKTEDLNKPFQFVKTIIGKRDGGYWDSMMAHNPYIIKIGDEYVLYYIGSPDGGTVTRKIGFAHTKDILGEWQRADKAIELPPDANNPCAVATPNNEILLYFRDGSLKVSVAKATRYDGEYTVLNDNIFPESGMEDMFVYPTDKGYEMLLEDGSGYYTGLPYGGAWFSSSDGIVWDRKNVRMAYDFNVTYDDGTKIVMQRRERPFLLFDGDRTYLFNAAKINGETQRTGGDTWNFVQEIKAKNE